MSLLRNLLGNFMPHFESRRIAANLSAVNASVELPLDGDNSATIMIDGTGTLNCTYIVEGRADDANWYPIICFPYAPASVGGTLPQPGQPIYTETVNAAAVDRMLCAAVGGLRSIRVRLSAYTGGNALVTINADTCESLSPYVRSQKAATLQVTATGAASAAVTATIPAVTGLRHYIDRVSVIRSATAALTASATPVVVTTTNLPGTPALTFGSDAGGIGVDVERVLDFGGAGGAATSPGVATTFVCPVWTGVIWRVNVAYRLGL
ncbi:hypothetical protein [Ottowia sp. SB7-C50]|uniref:hypothetical protein n=1 Tax=Ottowia sp. SB7-C50 TaxID=3081231 RepID=UPI00295557A0|nr:hypothetical protein [Ottowia sp. SB7-C50]WOP15756.1 hypothetical protein R0D99_01380 [Ottowia sp. SB7-C50]